MGMISWHQCTKFYSVEMPFSVLLNSSSLQPFSHLLQFYLDLYPIQAENRIKIGKKNCH